MDGKQYYDKHNKYPYFSRHYCTKSDGVFAEMQIIGYSSIIQKHIQIDLGQSVV